MKSGRSSRSGGTWFSTASCHSFSFSSYGQRISRVSTRISSKGLRSRPGSSRRKLNDIAYLQEKPRKIEYTVPTNNGFNCWISYGQNQIELCENLTLKFTFTIPSTLQTLLTSCRVIFGESAKTYDKVSSKHNPVFTHWVAQDAFLLVTELHRTLSAAIW